MTIGDTIYPVSTQEYSPYGEKLEIIKDLLETSSDNGTSLERMKHIFAFIECELLDDYDKSLPNTKVNLERSALYGLNNRRSEIEILAFILNITKGGAKKTNILYQANLSGRQLKNYLSFLINAEFINETRISKRGKSYSTTHKGNVFLFHWMKILSLLEM